MEPVDVQSTAIRTIQFDEENETVTVVFPSGTSVTKPCDKETYEEFLEADSKGKFWNQTLRNR